MNTVGFFKTTDEELGRLFQEVIKEMGRRNAGGMMGLVTSPSRTLREDFEFWGDGSDLVPDELRIVEDE